ncbi:MAG: hypothetical protein ACQEVT_12755 [Pseudomonadota bacterium]|uniref:hypothetical protein n=1 Tax=Roseovarius sp. TaxID=1486281 RepID=UPI0035621155
MHATTDNSVARIESPAGWSETGERPDFREITVVTSGVLHVEAETGVHILPAGEAVICGYGEWMR